MSERPEWCFSIGEAASWLEVPEDSIRHAIKAGKLPAIRIGNNIRIRRSDLFLAKAESQPEGQPK